MVNFSSFLEARNLLPSAAVMLAIRHTSGYMIVITGWQQGCQWLRDAPALPPERQKRGMVETVRSPNRLLASLPSADFELLRRHLKTINWSMVQSCSRLAIPSSASTFRIVALSLWSWAGRTARRLKWR